MLQYKRYRYTDGSRSSGILMREPSIYFNYSIVSDYLSFDREVINTMTSLGCGKDAHLVYGRVIEEVSAAPDSPSDGTAFTEYVFLAPNSGTKCELITDFGEPVLSYDFWECGYIDGGSEFDISQMWSRGLNFGKMSSVTTYKGRVSEASILSRTIYTYDDYHQRGAPLSVEMPTFWGCQCDHGRKHVPASSHLRSTTEKIYSENCQYLFSKTTSRTIDANGHLLSTSFNIGCETVETRYSYLGNLPLVTAVTSLRDGRAVARKSYSYVRRTNGATGDWYLPEKVTQTPYVNGAAGSSRTVMSVTGYDCFGNIASAVDALGTPSEYAWTCGGQCLGSITRHPSASSSLTLSMSWEPLVGMTSIRQPSGKERRYAYDGAGRLTSIRDGSNALLSSYSYHILGAADNSWTDAVTYRTSNESSRDVTYYNGLGLPEQEILTDIDLGYDMVQTHEYDALLREARIRLPFPVEMTGGEYCDFASESQESWYGDFYGTDRPWSERTMEFSTGGRTLAEYLPGEGYQDHPTRFSYVTNTCDDMESYEEGIFLGVRSTDGDGRTAVEWKDLEGRTVLSSRTTGSIAAVTEYSYNADGRLEEVTTPMGNRYQYSYDGFGRVTSKTVPGRAAETFTYDALDRVITSRDGNQRANGITICNAYDNVGNLTRRDAVKNGVARPMAIYVYSPTTGLKTSETFYELDADGWVSQSGSITRSFTYDSEERPVRVIENHSSGEYLLTTTFTYDLAGNILTQREQVDKDNGDVHVVLTTRTYDHRSRLTRETVKLDGVQKSDVFHDYDELGRQCRKDYGSGSESITEETSYTVQGWTSSTRNSLLTQNYAYETSANPSWTGNITRWDWRHLATADEAAAIAAAENGTGFPTMSETFAYDSLGRLSGSSMTRNGQPIGNAWSERNISYDLEGNILSLDRYQDDSDAPVNQLRFTYAGPRRSGYGYDSNGNVTYDPLRHFEIRNNLLNLPSVVWWSDPDDNECEGYDLSASVMYADGTRAGEMDVQSDGWFSRYVGSLIYDGGGSGEVLRGVVTADGFICVDGSSAANAQMQYFLRDQLGSVRVIATDRQHVISRDDYLPFGVRMTGNGLTQSGARSSWFGFSGKENEMFGDGGGISGIPLWQRGERYQHFGARTYDPATCTFLQVDPMAEKYYPYSEYGYCLNSPVNCMDPDGRDIKIITGRDKETNKVTVVKYNPDNGLLYCNTANGYSMVYDGNDPFARKVQGSLNFIFATGDPKCMNIISSLSSSERSHLIEQTEMPANLCLPLDDNKSTEYGKSDANKGVPVQTVTRLNDSLNEVSGMSTTFESSLIHELQHASDFDAGKMKGEIGTDSSKESENRAIFIENIIRRIQNFPRRED